MHYKDVCRRVGRGYKLGNRGHVSKDVCATQEAASKRIAVYQ